MSRVKIEKNIYIDSHNKYVVQMNRASLGGMYYEPGFKSLEDARNHLQEINSTYRKELNTGVFNNALRGGIKLSKQHEFNQYQKELRENTEFICSRCDKVKTIFNLNLHHIDHNRDNDSRDNFEVLCTVCHREEHNKRDSKGMFI